MTTSNDINNLIHSLSGVTIDEQLLTQIFTTGGYGRIHGVPHNEILAIFGDGILKLVHSLILYELFPDTTSGHLTLCKMELQSNQTFADLEIINDLSPYLLTTSETNEVIGKTIKATLYEALCYGIYSEGGQEAIISFVKNVQTKSINDAAVLYTQLKEEEEKLLKTRPQASKKSATPSPKLKNENIGPKPNRIVRYNKHGIPVMGNDN